MSVVECGVVLVLDLEPARLVDLDEFPILVGLDLDFLDGFEFAFLGLGADGLFLVFLFREVSSNGTLVVLVGRWALALVAELELLELEADLLGFLGLRRREGLRVGVEVEPEFLRVGFETQVEPGCDGTLEQGDEEETDGPFPAEVAQDEAAHDEESGGVSEIFAADPERHDEAAIVFAEPVAHARDAPGPAGELEEAAEAEEDCNEGENGARVVFESESDNADHKLESCDSNKSDEDEIFQVHLVSEFPE